MAKSCNWYSHDKTSFEGSTIASITSQFGLHQLINEPTHILQSSSSCIDLIFTSQPNIVVESGVHPSLHPNCHHQNIFAKFNLKIYYPPPNLREVWHYKEANADLIKRAINNFNWEKAFSNTNINENVSLFNKTILNILNNYIVWHDGIIYKLTQNGISGNLLNLLEDFLKERKQRAVLNGQVSTWKNINAGVPQGSILGPLLFLIYINDLTEGMMTNVKLFADDTSLFSVVHGTQTSANDLNKDLEIINNWAFQWKMNFNPDPAKQAHEVIFSRKAKEVYHPPLVFNNTSVSQSSSQKHLGVVLDSKLIFDEHLNGPFTINWNPFSIMPV